VIENIAFDIVESVPYGFDMSMTYAKQESPFVYPPEKFSDKVYERINEGSLMVSYVGHGSTGGFASLSWNGSSYPILDTGELEKMAVSHKTPILLFVACSTGSFDTGESISERIVALPNAPSSVISSTEVSHPVANAIFIYEFSQTIARLPVATVGEAFLVAKDRLITNNDAMREQIDSITEWIMSPSEYQALKRSHLHMYSLLGDPAMRIAFPAHQSSVVLTPAEVAAGGSVAVAADLGDLGAGDALVTLESTRSVILGTIEPVPADGDPGRDAVIEANYATANSKVISSQTVPHADGSLSLSIEVPADLDAGDYYVKVYADDGTSDSVGSAQLTVQ
jgi:hypothetical protein